MNASPAPDGSVITTPIPADRVSITGERLAHLENVNREYQVTINTLAIVVEQLLEARGDSTDTVFISPEARTDAPDLWAGVDPSTGQIWIKVKR